MFDPSPLCWTYRKVSCIQNWSATFVASAFCRENWFALHSSRNALREAHIDSSLFCTLSRETLMRRKFVLLLSLFLRTF